MIKETIERVKSETPDYFKKVRTIAIGLVTAATVIIGISTQVFIPENIITVCTYVIAIGSTMGITAQTTKK